MGPLEGSSLSLMYVNEEPLCPDGPSRWRPPTSLPNKCVYSSPIRDLGALIEPSRGKEGGSGWGDIQKEA